MASNSVFENMNKQIQNKVKSLSEQLDLDSVTCLMLLRKYHWNDAEIIRLHKNKLLPDVTCTAVIDHQKINKNSKKRPQTQIECGICLKDTLISDTFSLKCGHAEVCKTCWIDYLLNAVKTKECMDITCPKFKCNVIVSPNEWKLLLFNNYPTEYQRYLKFWHDDFIQCTKQLQCKLCGKQYSRSTQLITTSKELFDFCKVCQLSKPTECKRIFILSQYNNNKLWIFMNTRQCPKCHVHIEFNKGSIHMTCRKHATGCGHEFCWLCLGDWSTHGAKTGGYYECNLQNTFLFNQKEKELIAYYNILQPDHKNVNGLINWNHYSDTSLNINYKLEKEFILYQSFITWANKFNIANIDNYDYKKEFLRGFINFKSVKENLNLLFYGYVHDINVYIPFDIAACCMSFCIDTSHYERYNPSGLNYGLLTDKWDPNIYIPNNDKHIYKYIKIKNKCKILELNGYKTSLEQTIFGQYKITSGKPQFNRHFNASNCTRKVWKIKVLKKFCLGDESLFKIGVSSKNYTDLYSTYGVKEGDIICILFINYFDHSMIKFGINNNFIQHQTRIIQSHKNDIFRLTITILPTAYFQTNNQLSSNSFCVCLLD